MQWFYKHYDRQSQNLLWVSPHLLLGQLLSASYRIQSQPYHTHPFCRDMITLNDADGELT